MLRMRLVVVCLAVLELAAVGGEAKAPEGQGTDETTKLITYLAREFNYSFLIVGATPAKRLEEIIADDVTVVWSNGERSQGKAQCLERIAKAREDIRTLFSDFAVSYETQKVRFIGDVAIILGKVTLLGTLADDERPFRRETWQTLVFVKTGDDAWHLVHEHANQVPAPRPPEPSKSSEPPKPKPKSTPQ